MDYTLIAALLFYILAMQLFAKSQLRIVGASCLAVFGPFLLGLAIAIFVAAVTEKPLTGVFGLGAIVTVGVQLLAALVLFRILEREEESYAMWLGWGALGCALIYFVIPDVVSRLI